MPSIQRAVLAAAYAIGSVVASIEPFCGQQCAQGSLAFAYQYGYPLYSYGLFVNGVPNATTNTLYHGRKLTTPETRGVVKPNADTLYSAVFNDLSSSDWTLTIPDFGDRYWVYPLYDAYGNNVANIGSIANSPAGKYLIRFDQTNVGVQTTAVRGDYKAYLNLPTTYGISLMRILVSNNTADLQAVNALQDSVTLSSQPRNTPPIAPPLNLSTFSSPQHTPSKNTTLASAILHLTASLAPYNEPYIPSDRPWVSQTLLNAGLNPANKTFTQPQNTNLTLAVSTANDSVTALRLTPGFTQTLGNTWTTNDPRIIGTYTSFYQLRYGTAVREYLALTRDQALYPLAPDIHLRGDQACILRFSAKPKIKKGGFWSLTAYAEDRFLIPNEMGRYNLGDRDEIAYTDGDGGFEILIQPGDVRPPANWTSNWLPAPEGGGIVSAALRFYGAEESMTNGEWVYPEMAIVDAIRG